VPTNPPASIPAGGTYQLVGILHGQTLYVNPGRLKGGVEFTKSRPRQTNDNALAESKNGAVIRKIMGYRCIKQKLAVTPNQRG